MKMSDEERRNTPPSETESVGRGEQIVRFSVDNEIRTDNQGNPIGEDGRYIVSNLNSVNDISDKDFKNPYRNIELPSLSKENVNKLGITSRPVLIKKSIFEKSKKGHNELSADESRKVISAALYDTDYLINDKPQAKKNYWVLVRVGDKNALVTIDVDPAKSHIEIVGWRRVRNESLEQIKNRAYREGGQVLITQKGAAGLSALNEGSVSAAKIIKDFENPNISQE